MTLDNLPTRSAVRLDPATRQAIATIAPAITVPHRKPPTLADVIRAALTHTAGTVRTTGALHEA